jgi:membrane protein DedA with SNARE-associated domain
VADQFLAWVAGLPQAGVYGVLIALSAIENVFPPVPADVAVVLGAFLSQRGQGTAYVLGTVCWLANLSSSAGMYFYARSHGRSFFDHHWVRRLMPHAAVMSLERAYARYGLWAIFFSRFLPGLRAAVTPFAGLLGVSPARALLPAGIASGIWYAFLVAVGTTLGMNWDRAKVFVGDANRVLATVSVVAVGLLIAWLWRHRHREGDERP